MPIRDERGKILYWIGTCTDIEDVKRLEEALRDADRRKDEFLATLAHELRNPLAPIRNVLHLMKHEVPGAREVEHDRAMAERQVTHLARLIDDLMDVARISRGKIDLRKETVDLATVVLQAVETARPQIDERRHGLTVSLPEDPIAAGGRSDPPRTGSVEPAEQRRQVHRAGWRDRPEGVARRGSGRGEREGLGRGHPHRDPATHFRDVRAG